jgi:hypothetical protein
VQGKLRIPVFQCDGCKKTHWLPATAAGCAQNKPVEPSHWIGMHMLTLYHALRHNGGELLILRKS